MFFPTKRADMSNFVATRSPDSTQYSKEIVVGRVTFATMSRLSAVRSDRRARETADRRGAKESRRTPRARVSPVS